MLREPRALASEIRGAAGNRALVVFVDYDGTLVPIAERPDLAVLPDGLRARLTRPVQNGNAIVIASGRGRAFLSKQLSGLPVSLAAEHGAYIKLAGDDWVERAVLPKSIRERTESLFQSLAKDVPGSVVEVKEQSIAWHYRCAEASRSQVALEVVRRELTILPVEANLLHGNHIVEVRPAAANKGAVIDWYCSRTDGFPIAIGDDSTDEEMFAQVNARDGLSVSVGDRETCAKYRLTDPHAVWELLGAVLDI